MPDQNSEDPSCSIKRQVPHWGVFHHHHYSAMALWIKKSLETMDRLCAVFILPPVLRNKMVSLVFPHRCFYRHYFSRN